MKKKTVFNHSTSAIIIFVSLFINFCQSIKCQTIYEDSTIRQNATKPRIVVHKTGQPSELFYDSGTGRFLVDSADTQGAWSLVELIELPGYKTPLHVHATWDESFYVLEGTLTAKVADSIYTLPAGSYILIPRGTPHGQANFGTVDHYSKWF